MLYPKPLATVVLSIFILTINSIDTVNMTIETSDENDCVVDLAVICLDDKLITYVDWLEKRDKLNVIGNLVTIVKKTNNIEDRNKIPNQHKVSNALGPAIDEYFDTHTLRISLPWILDDDIDLELDQQGRGKKSKLKHMKKMMSMLGVVMCAKVSMLGPLAVFMIGAKALKALILSVMALTISKIILLKKLKSGGHSGSTQVEWVSEKDDQNAHLLAYANQAKISVVTSQPAIASVYQHQVQPLYPSREIQPGYH
ncbi:uncharacterized protein LOC126900243 isoform X2 [Daktulosphaira vitifoliae]|uniref:uncharacterized protein LOC126900243 isoform X2 n=1 Tax=Daktulosphaira vitifoliae TaxID=58002 RepID=UPI0021A9BBB3|nr:uncharacterized protein LOC126900243 isoform X2 [Daktulosphaira vitifoliae]